VSPGPAPLAGPTALSRRSPEGGTPPRRPEISTLDADFRPPDPDFHPRAPTRTIGDVLDLVLLRHGQSTWNAKNLFTGWVDVDLTAVGEAEAKAGGELLLEAARDDERPLDLRMLHTSVLTRAIRTAEIALAAAGRSWLPVRRDWRLNERHYGDLQGKNKAEIKQHFGEEQLMLWRRSYATRPPPLAPDNPYDVSTDPRYRDVDPTLVPRTECLADVVRRVVPYWDSAILPDLRALGSDGGAVLVVAHGNSIRALRKHLEGISEDAITGLEIPTGIPYRMLLDDRLTVRAAAYLGDPDAAAAAAAVVARQADQPVA
jgi:2,3-bisphosphoglycerate-dependent phosphoglycerate mutase